MSKDNELDDLFKRNLEDPVNKAAYNEGDWDALEQMLNKKKKKRIVVYWWPMAIGAAALLLLFFGWWIFKPEGSDQYSQNKAEKHQKINKDLAGHPKQQNQPLQQKASQVSGPLSPENLAVSPVKGRKGGGFIKPAPQVALIPASSTQTTAPQKNDKTDTGVKQNLMAKTPGQTVQKPQTDATFALSLPAKPDTGAAPGQQKKPAKIRSKQSFSPRYALSILGAPDINGVGGFQQSKVGTNVGFLFSVGITKKLTVSTGAIYSVKPYLTGFGNYHTPYQFKVTPTTVTADCRMLDLPLDIAYQVYNRRQNKISIGTGLSSYIMLRESYKFSYADTYETGPSNYTVPGTSKYFFGVLNLKATYQHQVNSKFGISIQPYLKLPLGNIGYSQVHLQTTGIAVGVTWNLNPLPKP